ncbi:hypothetical protein ACIRRA_30750 [Nocardia sp. NPDC101769]|uniref:hypothetical protein n=1 Tax=Nocardia sp. NPDC101769 TaxID=3364333 RepID=UPI00380ED8BA
MHSEHEEAMRADFHDRQSQALKMAQPEVSDDQRYEIADHISEFDQRWASGPYADEWAFLRAAHADWHAYPEQMGRFARDLEASRDVWEDYGLTDVNRRSVTQARHIAHEERAALAALSQRQPIRRER